MKCAQAIVVAVLLVASPALAVDLDGASFVHLFEWSHADVATECETFLGPKGFTAVQISPPNEHIQGDQWWTRYQPVSYNFTSRSGDEDAFKDMISRCNDAGVEIIVDAVVNHMAAAPSTTSYGVGGTPYYPGRKYAPYGYDPEMMHHTAGDSSSNCAVTNYDDMENVQQCDLVGLVDLDTESDDVSEIIASYLSSATAAGAFGFRIDAAKHIHNTSVEAFLSRAEGAQYVFQEVIYGSGEAVQPEQYTSNGDVTEFRFGTNLYANFNQDVSDKMQYMTTFGTAWGMIDASKALVFTDNHDTQRSSDDVLTYKDGQYYNMANYFMLAHPYGTPNVMSSYYFTDTDAGPPSVAVHEGDDGNVNCDDGVNWVCEHRRTGIANMVKFRAVAADAEATNWQQDSSNGNHIAFNREDKGFIAINMDPYNSWSTTVTVQVPDGEYCNIITAEDVNDCDGNTVVVSNGQAQITVDALNAVATHVDALYTP